MRVLQFSGSTLLADVANARRRELAGPMEAQVTQSSKSLCTLICQPPGQTCKRPRSCMKRGSTPIGNDLTDSVASTARQFPLRCRLQNLHRGTAPAHRRLRRQSHHHSSHNLRRFYDQLRAGPMAKNLLWRGAQAHITPQQPSRYPLYWFYSTEKSQRDRGHLTYRAED